jgi:hypothetical protein
MIGQDSILPVSNFSYRVRSKCAGSVMDPVVSSVIKRNEKGWKKSRG